MPVATMMMAPIFEIFAVSVIYLLLKDVGQCLSL